MQAQIAELFKPLLFGSGFFWLIHFNFPGALRSQTSAGTVIKTSSSAQSKPDTGWSEITYVRHYPQIQ